MATTAQPVADAKAHNPRDDDPAVEHHGALVGWVHHEFGDRLLLRLETLHSMNGATQHHPDLLRVLMTKQQAAVLGNYLMEVSGQTRIGREGSGWFRRLFG